MVEYPSHMKDLSIQQWLHKFLDAPSELKDPILMSISDFITGYIIERIESPWSTF
jgi:arsenate reductase-like glutaredoxin family protein